MDDTNNWEFAAAIAAVCIGLGGLVLMTLIGTIGTWRIFAHASRAARAAELASIAVQDLARRLDPPPPVAAPAPNLDLSEPARRIDDLRRQADGLIEQQARLQEAVRNLLEAGVLRGEESNEHLTELEGAIRRLEDNLSRVAAAVANLGQKLP